MLTDAELEQLRVDIAETLPDDIVIEKPATTRDSYGYPAPSWTVAGTVSGRLDPMPQSRAVQFVPDYEQGRYYYLLTVPHDADIQDGYRVKLGGDVYTITLMYDAHSLRAVRRAVVARGG